ncbi:hypothetical protein XENOCAPTIV_001238 [Xenoophorus captivus]|uniref:Dilute domain-containing protein n=1 Tax=Xenoophorus captivus TaxID=1517983 RepID=A0ABV0RTC9_9TELE
MRIFAKKCQGSAVITRYVNAVFILYFIMRTDNMQSFDVFYCNNQAIPELKLQVSELQRQNQELEAIAKEQSSEFAETYTISSILQQLSVFHSAMSHHGMEQSLVKQAVKQLFFLVGATTFNQIMLRKDMCSCRKGMQISYLEEWLKETELQSSGAIDTLRPLAQAAWLLQVNKSTNEDAKEITEKCTELNPVQVLHVSSTHFLMVFDVCFTLKPKLASNLPDCQDFEFLHTH